VVKVLVVESDAAVRDALSACLELEHYDVSATADLVGGLQVLAREQCDLILADLYSSTWDMPKIRPLDELARVAPMTPVVLTTTNPEARELQPGSFGLAGILVKPFDLNELFACVTSAQEHRRRHMQSVKGRTVERLAASRVRAEETATLLRSLRLA